MFRLSWIMTIQVRLLDHSHDPIRSLYIAYRTCYSSLTPLEIADRVEDDRITREQMLSFVEERLKTGHGSPLEQVWFEFLIAGVSRSFRTSSSAIARASVSSSRASATSHSKAAASPLQFRRR